MDFSGRREKLRKLLKKTGAEALLVTSAPNVTYLTGFTGDSSYLLVTQANQILISDGRYLTQIEEECPGLEMNIRRAGVLIHQQVAKILRAAGISRLAIEADSMTVATRERIAEKLPKLEIGATSGMVEHLRQVKDKEELALIRQAARIAEKSFAVIRAGLRPEQTEKQIGDALEHQIPPVWGRWPGVCHDRRRGASRGPAARQVDRSPRGGWGYFAGRLGGPVAALQERLDAGACDR